MAEEMALDLALFDALPPDLDLEIGPAEEFDGAICQALAQIAGLVQVIGEW